MTGNFLFVPKAPAPMHVCEPPVERTDVSDMPVLTSGAAAPRGTVWQCGVCDATWVVKRAADGFDDWFPESALRRCLRAVHRFAV